MGNSSSQEYEQASPPKPEAIRTLTIDPRSPTQDIARTPIVVEKTPEGALSGPEDPRSPTVGIVRTPLSLLQKSDKERVADWPKFPVVDLTKEPSGSPESTTEELEDHPLLTGQDVTNLSLSEPISESTRLVPNSKEQDAKDTDEPDNIKLKKKKKQRASQPKELFPSMKSSALKDSTRSPLSSRNIDMNSPLQIVQRKQIKEIDIKRTCAQENAMSRFIAKDKENM